PPAVSPRSTMRSARGPNTRRENPMGLQSVLGRYETRLKGTRFSSDIARYNPLYYGRVRRAIERSSGLGLEGRREQALAFIHRVLRKAQRTAYGSAHGPNFADWPVLPKAVVAKQPGDFVCRSLFAVPATTGGTTGTPLRLVRSLLNVT